MKNIIPVSLALLLSFQLLAAEKMSSLRMGVFPYLPPYQLHQIFNPSAKDFEKHLGMTIKLSTASSYEGFLDHLWAEDYDIAAIQAFDYPKAHDFHNYLPLAAIKEPFMAILVVNSKSNIRTLADLQKKTIAYMPNTAALRLTKQLLHKKGYRFNHDFRPLSQSNHASCLHAVLTHLASACITLPLALSDLNQSGYRTTQFREILRSPPVPHGLYIVHKRVPKKIHQRLLDTVLSWPHNHPDIVIKEPPHKRAFDQSYDIYRKFLKDSPD